MVKKIISWLRLANNSTLPATTAAIVLLVVLIASLAACSAVATPAKNAGQNSAPAQLAQQSAFVVRGFAVNPTKVTVGDTVSIVADVINSGTATGTYDAVLRINNAVVISKAVAIPAGVTQGLNFVVPTDNAGTYEATLGGLTGTFTVIDNPVNVTPTSASNSSSPTPNAAATASCCSPPTPTAAPSVPTPALPKASGGCCAR